MPLNGSVTDTIGTSNPSVQGTNAGSIAYVSGIVGTRAINLINPPVGTAAQFVKGTWTAVSNFSVSLWINPQSASASMIIFSIGSALQIQTNGTSGLQLTAPGISSSVSYPVTTNIWYNITVIYQANSTCYFYVNNVLIASPTSTGSVPSGSYSLGTYDSGTSNAFNGYIDDLKIYNSAITFTPMVPQNWSNVAVSNTGQYMLAAATGAGLYMSSNFGSTWTQVSAAMLYAAWSAAQISATGQYMLAYSTPVMVQPQLTGLTGNTTTATPVATSWQIGGVTWTSNSSSVNTATFQSWCAFNNVVPPNNSLPSYSWASSVTYTSGTYSGSVSTTIISPGPGAYTGEWIQIQSSVPIVIYSYNFACAGAANIPKTYFIIGSNDGSTWYPIQLVSIGTNPFTTSFTSATSSPIIVNQSGSQTMTAGTSGTLTCTTYTTNTTAAYTYFRFIANTVFPTGANFEFTELYLTFQAGGQTYSTNYGSTWNNGYALPTPTALSLSESGQYAIGANNSVPSAPIVYVTSNFLQGFSTGTSTTPTFQTALGTGNVPVASAVSNTGQYMVLITNNTSGNNVYYSINYGAYFAAFTLGTQVLTSCAISYDGSYITVSNATTTWILNNNSNGFSLALGNQAGYQNQGQNAIAIGNGAGSINQTANSIILNASGSAVNAFAPGFYVAPIASYVASSSQSFGLLGYGIGTGGDSQITQGIGLVSTVLSNIFLGQNAGSNNTTGYQNIFLGQNAGQSNTTGNLIIYIGQNVGILNTTGYQNVVIGQDTGAYITTAYNTTVVGMSAGKQLINGYNNCFFGTAAGQSTTTGNANTFLGVLAGAANTNGANNVCIGANSGQGITSGLHNTIVGTSACNAGTITGLYNTALGFQSAFNLSSGTGNIGLGWDSLRPVTSGNYNIGLGVNSGGIVSSGTFNMYLGTNAIASSATVSNEIVISSCSINGEGKGGNTFFLNVRDNNNNAGNAYQANNNSAWATTSDRRIKRNITDVSNGLNIILALHPVEFDYIVTNIHDTGFIAQEYQNILPNQVTYHSATGVEIDLVGKGNKVMGIQQNLVPYVVKAIQEQNAVITAQQLQIDALIQRLAAANIA